MDLSEQTHPLLSTHTTEILNKSNNDHAQHHQPNNRYARTVSNANDELWQFRLGLLWLGLQRLTLKNFVISWVLFFICALVIPVISIFYVDCEGCSEYQSHPFDKVVQISESALCAIGYISLCKFMKTYGLRKMLLLDQIGRESREVQDGYQKQLQDAFQLLMKVLLPCFIVELIHKISWFAHAKVHLPFITNDVIKNVGLCILMMISWLYRAACFLLICVLFRLTCTLEILRLKAYYKILESNLDQYYLVLKEHMKMRTQLVTMSHRFRNFLLSSLVTITLSQIASLFIVTSHIGKISFQKVGDLAVCSATQVVGIVFCLHGAAKITHASQRIVSFVSRWHAMCTCFDHSNCNPLQPGFAASTVEFHDDIEVPSSPRGVIQVPSSSLHSFCKRSSLVDYFYHCGGSVTIYGFVIDRRSIYGIFALELSLMLWTLGKTVLVQSS